jgi:uncharacterized protein DUF6745
MLERWFGRSRSPKQPTVASGWKIPGFTPSSEVKRLILTGQAPRGLFTDRLAFEGVDAEFELPANLQASHLVIQNCPRFRALPRGLLTQSIRVSRCAEFLTVPSDCRCTELVIEDCGEIEALPEGLSVSSLSLNRCSLLRELPRHIHCQALHVTACPVEVLPSTLRVEQILEIHSPALSRLPPLRSTRIDLSRCTGLRELPAAIEALELNLSGCTSFRWPEFSLIEAGRLDVCDCVQLTSLPDWIIVTESIDVANTHITELPDSLRGCRLRWRGVEIDERVAFHPEDIRTDEVLAERNAEKRRVLLERIGWEKFLASVKHQVCDRDTDAGGERRLLKFIFSDNEQVLVLTVGCPSTGRRYFIRVPPWTERCHQAAAWIAGFDDPRLYEPAEET